VGRLVLALLTAFGHIYFRDLTRVHGRTHGFCSQNGWIAYARRPRFFLGDLDLFLVLGEGEASELLLRLDDVAPHFPLKEFLEGLIEDRNIFHHKCLCEELLRLLGIGKLYEDFELLLFGKVLDLALDGLRALLLRRGQAGKERLHASLNHVELHLTLVEGLHVKFENVRARLVLKNPQEKLHVSIVQFTVYGVRVCQHARGQTDKLRLSCARTTHLGVTLSHGVVLNEA